MLGVVLVVGCSVDVGKLRALGRDAASDIALPPSDGGADTAQSRDDSSEVTAALDSAGTAGDARDVGLSDDVGLDSAPGPDLPLGGDAMLAEVGADEAAVDVAEDSGVDSALGTGGGLGTGGVIGAGGMTGVDGGLGAGGMTGTGGVMGGGGATETGGAMAIDGGPETGGVDGTGGTTATGGATGTSGSPTVNLALTGAAYRWAGNTSATANTYRYVAPVLNDDSVATEVNLNGTGDEYYSSAWEAAGVVLGQAASVTRVEFVNGSTAGGTYAAYGYFMANFRLQTSTDGTTWVDATGWTLTPAYPYGSAAGDQTYTFAGQATGVLGVRVVGQVGTSMYSGSWHVMAREVRVWGAAGGTSPALSFEAETLTYTASYRGASNSNEPCPTGTCYYVQLNDPASLGDYIEFTIPSLSAGTYGVTMYYKSNYNRGIVQGRMDGVVLARTCDEYADPAAFLVPCNLGSSSLTTSGSHKLRFTVTGRNSASSGYMIVVDRIVLTAM